MRTEPPAKSRTLRGVTDLTLLAPLKRGLIPALDARSYESRAALLLRTLSTLRTASLEADLTPTIVDTVDAIRGIHSFRLALVGEETRQVLLSVAFDGGWESYMRRIWRDLGPLLDVIFCNCEGYPLAARSSFADYMAWVRRSQVNTAYFYNAAPLTVGDLYYLRDQVRPRANGDSNSLLQRTTQSITAQQQLTQSLPALAALYRLTDMYPPLPRGADADGKAEADAACLKHAAHYLLGGLSRVAGEVQFPETPTPTEQAAWNWFNDMPQQPAKPVYASDWDAREVQGGIVQPYPGLTHACLLLLSLDDAAAAQALLAHLQSTACTLTSAGNQNKNVPQPFVNLGLTFEGLRMVGVDRGLLAQLPQEFRDGMAARSGILGDVLVNHPTHWPGPARNWPFHAGRDDERIELSSVHAVLQLSTDAKPAEDWLDLLTDEAHPLRSHVTAFELALREKGVHLLGVQPMQRVIDKSKPKRSGHFGWADGLSQPSLADDATKRDQIKPGDLLLGFENSLGDSPLTGRLWTNSTFLVVRKYRQNVAAWNQLTVDTRTSIMGRGVDGEPLIEGQKLGSNDFDYRGDDEGSRCPLHSHVRRANPRTDVSSDPPVRPDLRALPRIMRRGLSYGPPQDKGNPTDERGIVFMGFNASIAEQFELIQSWLAGGNSASSQLSYSARRDPMLGVAQEGDIRSFDYVDKGGKDLPEDWLTRLEWGAYLFVPSMSAVEELKRIAADVSTVKAASEGEDKKRQDDQRKLRQALLAQKGAALIGRLQMVEQLQGVDIALAQWKIALEDVGARMTGASQAIWTALRDVHQGALRTPYGVLVGSKERVREVFDNKNNDYSVTGYADRMKASFGEIYLGMDRDDERYATHSKSPNDAIMKVTQAQAFDAAFSCMQEAIRILARNKVETDESPVVEVKDIVDDLLARLSLHWFGLPDGTEVEAGGWHWRSSDQPPTCPGHFHSPSRYMFQPNPGPETSEIGQCHGKLLRGAVGRFVDRNRADGGPPGAELARVLFAAESDNAQLTSNLIGVMMGFLPTVDGSLRGLLYEWVNDQSLWDHQLAYERATGSSLERARSSLYEPMVRTMQLRPVPEVVWRTAVKRHSLARAPLPPIEVQPGDRIVVGIVSASQQCLAEDELEHRMIFGGERLDAASPSPQHACPAYNMAMGVLLGALAGLMEVVHMRPTHSPVALRLRLRRLKRAQTTAPVGDAMAR